MKLPHGTIEQVADGIFVCAPNPGEGTMGVVTTSQAKVAIDTSSYDRFAMMVKEAVDQQSPVPWRYVITTHCHFDHIGGNQVFPGPIVASRLTDQRMQEYTPQWLAEKMKIWREQGLMDEDLLAEPRIVFPDLLFDKNLTIRLDDLTLEITLLGGHSNDSSVIFIPERGVLFAADLVFNGKPAAIHEADIELWLRSLETMQQMQPQIVVAGHGPPGGPELLTAQAEELKSRNT